MSHASTAKQLRGDRLVANVLEAAIAELSNLGTQNISVENVAERARVNKTTIYRRWPTPERLIRDALMHIAREGIVVPNTGTLRADLSKLLEMLRILLASPHTHALIRMHLGGTMHGELARLALTIQRQKDKQMKTVFVRAVERGELPPETDIDLLYDTLVGAFFNLAVFRQERASLARMERAIDLILDGAKNSARPWREKRPRGAKSDRPRADR
ncbi:MAG: TetR/AcrR family transcriptional regulator C-terminal ligand-binding domain-containing protein [Polyangiaceae bacterium]